MTLVTGFLLIGVAWNLAIRRLMAWLLTVWLLIISALSHVLYNFAFKSTIRAKVDGFGIPAGENLKSSFDCELVLDLPPKDHQNMPPNMAIDHQT